MQSLPTVCNKIQDSKEEYLVKRRDQAMRSLGGRLFEAKEDHTSKCLLLQSRTGFLAAIIFIALSILLFTLVLHPRTSLHTLNTRARHNIISNKLCNDALHIRDGGKNTQALVPQMRHVVQAKDFEFISRHLLPKQTSSDSTSLTLPSMTMVDKLVIPVLAEKERELLQTLDDKLMALHFKEDQVKLARSKSLFESPYLPVTVGNYRCRNSHCSEFLSGRDLYHYRYCLAQTRTIGAVQAGKCHFMDGSHRAPVALASFPGSGNTWVRGLLEQATGICTGSIYCDKSIRARGMNGENLRSGSVLVTKTHRGGSIASKVLWTASDKPRSGLPRLNEVPVYGACILLVRNPYHALVAEWTRSNSIGSSNSHIAISKPSQFMNNTGWTKFVKTRLPKWMMFFNNLVINATQKGHPLLVVRYEDVKTDSFGEVKRMLNFLNISYNEDELKERMSEDFGKFHRKHGEEFEHFTPQQSSLVRETIRKTIDYLKQHNNGDTLKLEEYLE